MAARIAGFRSRADLGLRAPRSVSRRITPATGGCAPHWGGPAPGIGSHADCEATWRGYQRYHMDTKGWTDIAYTAGFCQHGYVLAGRGLGVRPAANGTNDGNQRFYAFVWVGGVGMTPTTEALDALDWLVVNARQRDAGWDVWPHRRFTGSSCPGDDVIAHAATIDGKPIGFAQTEEEDVIERDDTGDPVTRLQWRINAYLHGQADPQGAGKGHGLVVDGVFGPKTEDYVRHVQAAVGWTKHPGKADAALLALLHDLVFDHEVRA